MIKTIKVEICGRTYEVRQMAARPGLDYAGRVHSAVEMCIGVAFSVNGIRFELDTDEKINRHVMDLRGVVPAHKVLGMIYAQVIDFNFGFLKGRKSPKVPRRFKADVDSQSVEELHPTISTLIASGKATMAELETIYSVEDAIIMSDVILVEGINKALAHEDAVKRARKR